MQKLLQGGFSATLIFTSTATFFKHEPEFIRNCLLRANSYTLPALSTGKFRMPFFLLNCFNINCTERTGICTLQTACTLLSINLHAEQTEAVCKRSKGPKRTESTALGSLFSKNRKNDYQTNKQTDKDNHRNQSWNRSCRSKFCNQFKWTEPVAINTGKFTKRSKNYKEEKAEMKFTEFSVFWKQRDSAFFCHMRKTFFPAAIKTDPAAPAASNGNRTDKPD